MAKQYRNHMEQVVEASLREYLKSESGVCSCDQCFGDMAALALNQLTPRYSTSIRGAAFLEDEQKNLDFVIQVISAVKSAAEAVKKSPRHPVPGK